MRFPLLAALLIAPLAACGSNATGDAGTPPTDNATEVAVVAEASSESFNAEASPGIAKTGADEDACGADKLGRWLNVLPTDDVKAEIAATVGERPIRYYGPNDAVTMDFNTARLNVELGADGRIKRFRCG